MIENTTGFKLPIKKYCNIFKYIDIYSSLNNLISKEI